MDAETTLIEEINKVMINNSTEIPTSRIAHFIKPTLSAFSLLPKPPKIESLSLICKPKVSLRGNPPPLECWLPWVKQLVSKNVPVWRKAGIFDAIKGSTYHIENHIDLLLCLAEKWCPESNTFVFPWGEVSITVEDVMVLGGFSPLGESVMSTSSVVDDVEEKLNKWRNEVGVIQATWSEWIKCFMGRGDELEHAAFLALWLSHSVFVTNCSRFIRPCVFSMAARLSRGVKFALAPAVLAIIYRELRLLKEKLVQCSHCAFDVDVLNLLAPFHLVQLWAWERFPRIAPIPRKLNVGEPILARWERFEIQYTGLKMELDSAGETFRWRPYPFFYDDVGKWVSIDSEEKWEKFAVCLRIGQLQGFDIEDAEKYNPHRVARQFGFDQDVPCLFPIASRDLNQLIGRTKLYVPSRSFLGEVTVRYANWWNGTSFLDEDDPLPVYTRREVRSHTSSLPMPLCPESLPQTEWNMLKNLDLDERMQQNPKKRLRLCDHQSDTRSDGNEEGGTVGRSESLVLPVECRILENEDLGAKMEQNPEKLLQLCENQTDTNSDDLPSMEISTETNLGMVKDSRSLSDDNEEGTVGGFESLVLPVEGKMLENEDDFGRKMGQTPKKLLQICDHQNNNTCGNLPPLVKGTISDLIVISDDEGEEEEQEEESGRVGAFNRLVLDIEKRISKLERISIRCKKEPVNWKLSG